MHAANGVRMHREGEVLMHASLTPEYTGRIGVIAFKWANAFHVSHMPGTIALSPQRDQRRSPAIRSLARFQPPAPQVMRAGNHTRTDALCHPGTVNVITNAGVTRTRSPLSTPILRASSGCI